MAYVSDKLYGEDQSTGGNFVVNLPPAATNDLFLVFVVFGSGSITGTPSGWTLEASTVLDNRIYCYTKVAGATPVTSMTPTGSAGVQFSYISIVIKDAPTSSYQDGVATRASGSSLDIECPTITTTTNNCLIFTCASGSNSQEIPLAPPGWNYLSNIGQSATFGSAAYTVQKSSGATGAIQYYAGGFTARNPAAVTIAIKDNSGTVDPYVDTWSAADAPAQVVHVMGGGLGSAHLTTGSGRKDISAGTGDNSLPTINSISTTNAGVGFDEVFDAEYLSPYLNSGSANTMMVAATDMASTLDLTGYLLCQTFSHAGQIKDWDDPSFGLVLGDGTNYRVFRYSGNDASPTPSKVQAPFVIELGAGFGYEDTGTFSVSTIDVIGQWYYNKTGNVRMYTAPLYKLQTMKALGGSSTVPCTMESLFQVTRTGFLNTIQNQSGQTTGQFFPVQSIQIGDGGTTSVYWDSTRQAIEYPGAPVTSGTAPRTQTQITEAALSFTVDAGAGKTVILNSQVFNMGDFHEFKLVSGSFSITSVVVSNATPTLTAIGLDTYSGLSFVGCKAITLSGFNDRTTKTVGEITISDTDASVTYAVVVTNQDELEALKNVTFSGNNYSIQITGNHGGSTWSLEGATVSGGTGSYDIQYTGTGALTITADSGSGFSTGRCEATGGGSITISAPTLDLTVNSDQTGSQIVVYTTNTQAALSTVASGTQLVFTHSSQTVDITVHKDGYIPYRQTGLALSGNITVNVSLVASREYDSSHGLTYTTDASIYDNFNYITGITQANPAVVTYSGADNFNNNDIISIQDVVGMTEINGKRYTVANVNTGANTFELSGINSTAYTAYSSGGVALSGLSIPTFGPSGRAVFSLLLEEFRTRAALDNLPFPIEMDGSNSFYLVDGVEGTADSDIENMTACGVAYLDVDGTQTATWVGVESIGTIPGGATGEYQQQDGSGTTDARTTGAFDEIIKVKGDANHGNFNYEGHLVLKYQVNGYYQSRVDVINTYGITALEPTHYIVAMEPAATGIATGDPAITISITDHTAAPITVGGKSFDYEIVGGANSAENILRELNYNHSLDATYNGKDPFNWPDMVIEVGGNYETQRGRVEGQDTTTTWHGIYVSQSGGDHPGFARFQSNDGTYYVPTVVSSISVTGMPTAGGSIRLQITNETAKTASGWDTLTPSVSTAALGDKILRSTGLGTENTAGLYYVCTTAGTIGAIEPTWSTTPGGTTNDGTVVWTTYKILYYDADPASASYADTYIDNEEFATGDTFGIRFAEINAATSFKTYETTGIVSSTGFTVVVSTTSDSVYATNAVDGSSAAVTAKFSPDYSNNEIDLDANQDFAATELFAYYCYELTTSNGMYTVWGAFEAIDEANYRNNVSVFSIFLDETAGFVKQTDSARVFRSDGTRPARDPTSGGFGIEVNWRNPVYGYDAGGGGFTASDRATLNAAATQASVNTVDSVVDAILVDTGTTLPATLTTIEGKIDTVDTVADSILVDTGTTLPATLTTIEGKVDTVDTVVDSILVDTGTTIPAQITSATSGLSTFDPSTDALEGAETYDQTLRIMRAAVAGKAAQSGTTETFRDAADTKDRITATVDADGQRTSVTTDGT